VRWWRWLRAWLSNQATLVALLGDAEAERDRLAAALRRERACRELEAELHRADVAALRREAESLDAGNRVLLDERRREAVRGNDMAHRLRKGHEFADRLPDELAAELRAALALTFPAQPEEATRAR
jgi:hypothetical protein